MAQTGLFPAPAKSQLSLQSLVDGISEFHADFDETELSSVSDKWLLASNLQKAIRRGLSACAMSTAARLIDVDPGYLWRRLPVIAFEDIGLANVNACKSALAIFRRHALHDRLGPKRVAAFLANMLANARKSRALCDAIAAMEFSVDRGRSESRCFHLLEEELMDLACSDGSVMDTVAALRHICGYREICQGSYRVAAKPRPDLMREVIRRSQLTETEALLFLSGQGVAESMNIPVPMIARMVRTCPGEEHKTDIESTGKNGILHAAFDRHTRIGKRAFANLAEANASVARFFRIRQSVDHVAAIGAGIFVLEGSLVDRRLVFHGDRELQETFERNFLEHARIQPDHQFSFLRILRRALPDLNRIRDAEIQ